MELAKIEINFFLRGILFSCGREKTTQINLNTFFIVNLLF